MRDQNKTTEVWQQTGLKSPLAARTARNIENITDTGYDISSLNSCGRNILPILSTRNSMRRRRVVNMKPNSTGRSVKGGGGLGKSTSPCS